jgi:sigma-B regulation protein RsbU (phosphoserine phosphatase)
VRRDGTLEAIDSNTLPFAMIEEMPMPVGELTLHPGDEITVFSDGIPEATTSGDRFLGLDDVKRILVENRQDALPAIRERIVAVVEKFLAGGPASDDVTLVMLRRRAG